MSGTRSPRVPWAAILAVPLVVLLASPAAAGGENGGSAARGPLDGMRFVGTFGSKGEPGDSEDTLYFADGKFWSKNCVPCGFAPAPYWVRYTDDAIHFKGRLESPQSGLFFYSGVVRDERVKVSINWRKERWYWTIDRDFWFEGELAPATAVSGIPSVTRAAMAAAAEERVCEP